MCSCFHQNQQEHNFFHFSLSPSSLCKVTGDENNVTEDSVIYFPFFSPKKKSPFHSSGVVNETHEGGHSKASGHKKGPCGRHRSRVRGPPCRRIGSDGTFDGVIERRDETRCTRSQAGKFCWVMFDGVCSWTHLYLSISLSLFYSNPQVLATHSEAERERAEAKRKIAKLEDALRYIEKGQTTVKVFKSVNVESNKYFYFIRIIELVHKYTVF